MKKLLWILFFFGAIISVYFIAKSFALLESRASGNVEINLGKWNITLNGVNVTENNIIDFSDLDYAENENVEDGYFAPGTSATYDITIDPSGTDVAVRYDILIDIKNLKKHPNIDFIVEGLPKTVNDDGTIVFSGFIPLVDVKNNTTLELNIEMIWKNIEEYNEIDSTLYLKDASLKIPITIKFSQYLGEEI